MRLINIEINNLFSIDNIKTSLEDLGLTLITGHSIQENSANGAGKSSFSRNSILWGLYGKILGSTSGDDVINRHSDGVASCKIEFIGNDGLEYKILRTRNPNKLILTQGSDDISDRLASDTQEKINSLIGLNFSAFVQANLFGQGRPISFCGLPVKEQRDIIENILPINKLDEWAEVAKDKKKNTLSALSRVERDFDINEAKIKALKDHISDVERKRVNYKKVIDEEVAYFERVIIDCNGQIDIIINKKIKSLDILADLQNQYNNMLKVDGAFLEERRDEWQKLKIIYNNNQGPIEGARQKISSLKNHILNLEDKDCKTCGQKISENYRNVYIQKAKEEISEYKDFIETSLEKSSIEKIHNAEQDFRSAKILSDQFINLKQNIINKQNDLNNFDDRINKLNISISEYKSKIQDLKSRTSAAFKILEDTEKNIKTFTETSKLIKKDYNKYKKEADKLQFWIQAFSKDLKTLLFERACPFLQSQANRYLKLLNNNQLEIAFSTVKSLKSGEKREEFSVYVESKTGGSLYSLLSGGEQQMINFAVNLALSDLAEAYSNGTCNVAIMDEPFTNLDQTNCDNVINFLVSHMSKIKSTILFISNEDGLKAQIPNRIHLIKENGNTRLEKQ